MEGYIVNILGLIFDMVGVIMLFFFGLPSEIAKGGTTFIISHNVDEMEAEKWKKYKRLSNFGLFLIFIGFTFQIVSNFVFIHNLK